MWDRLRWIAVISLCLSSLPVKAADVFISSPAFNPNPGQQFEVEITVETGSDILGSYFFNFQYNPAVVSIVSVAGGETAEFSSPPITDPSTFSAGVTPIADAQGNISSPSGRVSLAILTLQASNIIGGSSPLDVEVIELNDIGAEPFDNTVLSNSTQIAFNADDDTDGDGLSDVVEANAGTNINLPDSDGDGLQDSFEVLNGLDPLDNGADDEGQGANGDPDGDGLTNIQEQSAGSNPVSYDTDGDGLSDGVEFSLGTDLTSDDSDDDGLNDAFEVRGNLDPLDDGSIDVANGPLGDPDLDLLTNVEEQDSGTLPRMADSDNDGLPDGYELSNDFNPLDDGAGDPVNGAAGDPDEDGLKNIDEFDAGTDPRNQDSDGDLLSDGYEVDSALDPLDDGSDDFQQGAGGDPDSDGHTNLSEFQVSSDPQDKYSQPVLGSIEFNPGMNLISYPLDTPVNFSAFDFLAMVNSDSDSLESIYTIIDGQSVVEAHWNNGQETGNNFMLTAGNGVFANVGQGAALVLQEAVTCSSIDLTAGVNVVGFRCVPPGYTAFDLLIAIGDSSTISSIQNYDSSSGRYKTAVYFEGSPVGEDFSINIGESYVINMLVDMTGFDPLAK